MLFLVTNVQSPSMRDAAPGNYLSSAHETAAFGSA
jgi:hypothetical protein